MNYKMFKILFYETYFSYLLKGVSNGRLNMFNKASLPLKHMQR